MRLCAISVDLDEIHHYLAIHGLAAAEVGQDAAHSVYDRALPRFADFAASHAVPLTLFAVGADMSRPRNAALLGQLSQRGHEIGNHTLDHWYDLSRRSPEAIRYQIEQANDVLAAATGQRPVGFRAPGYVVTGEVYRAVAECGMSYSSSVFPCPYYYAAKLAAVLAMRLSGRASRSVIDGPGVLVAPVAPYRVGSPYWQPGSGVLELPIQVTPALRLPVFGTSLTLLGPRLARRLVRGLIGQPLINLELHGVDLLDRHDLLDALATHQFDLKISLEQKWRTLSAIVDELSEAGYTFVRLDEAARSFQA